MNTSPPQALFARPSALGKLQALVGGQLGRRRASTARSPAGDGCPLLLTSNAATGATRLHYQQRRLQRLLQVLLSSPDCVKIQVKRTPAQYRVAYQAHTRPRL